MLRNECYSTNAYERRVIVAPKPKFTKEQIVETAVDIIRTSSVEAITAQEIARRLGASTRPVFTYFDTLDDLRAAAAERAKQIYNAYAERGLKMTPAFKGYAMEYIRFAAQEPSLFRLLFMRKSQTRSLIEYLEQEGHLHSVRQTVMQSFGLDAAQADWLYENMWLYAHGIATLCASEAVVFSEGEIAGRLGALCRSLLITMNMPKDVRTGIVPGSDVTMPGTIEDYIHSHK